MSATASLQNLAASPKALSHSTHAGLLLQRKCACGSPTSSLTGECAECKSKKRLQTKLTIGASNDPLEQEADQVADQVLAAPANSGVSGTPPHIQRFAGQATGQAYMAPASADRVIASPGRPLDSALQQDMEQRFGHDFSHVRVHSDAPSDASARDVDAHAYTTGNHIVFAAGQYTPATISGRRLLAHELTHVVQQNGTARSGFVPPIQRYKKKERPKPKSGNEFSVESDHGARGRYLIHFERYHSPEAALKALFNDAKVPEGYKLENLGVDMLGWTWKLTTATGLIGAEDYPKLTPEFQKHFGASLDLVLTSEETAAQRASDEAMMNSRPDYLGGQSVREAFKNCKDNKIGEEGWGGCWGRRAGYFYYIGFQPGAGGGRELQVRSSPQDPKIIKDWEWWLNNGESLHEAIRKEEELQFEILKQTVLAFAGALSAAPGAGRWRTVPPSPARQLGKIAVTGAEDYAAWKTALGKDLTKYDMYIRAAAALFEHGLGSIPKSPQVKPGKPPTTEPKPQTPPVQKQLPPGPDVPAQKQLPPGPTPPVQKQLPAGAPPPKLLKAGDEIPVKAPPIATTAGPTPAGPGLPPPTRLPGQGITGRGKVSWGNPASRPAYGHSQSEHGAQRPAKELQDRANDLKSGGPQGQFYDNNTIVEAEQRAPLTPGAHDVPMGRPVGRVYMSNAPPIENVATVRVVRKPDLTVRTSMPIN